MAIPRYDQLEKKSIQWLGGKPHPASGALLKKHDGSNDEFLIEVKTTTQKSFSILRTYIKKLGDYALQRGLAPMMVVIFDDGPAVRFQDLDKYVVIEMEAFQDLWERATCADH